MRPRARRPRVQSSLLRVLALFALLAACADPAMAGVIATAVAAASNGGAGATHGEAGASGPPVPARRAAPRQLDGVAGAPHTSRSTLSSGVSCSRKSASQRLESMAMSWGEGAARWTVAEACRRMASLDQPPTVAAISAMSALLSR